MMQLIIIIFGVDKRRKRASGTFTPLSSVGVRKDSVIGVYFDNSNPLPVIGTRIWPVTNGGACVTDGSNSTEFINCSSGNIEILRVIQVESTISK